MLKNTYIQTRLKFGFFFVILSRGRMAHESLKVLETKNQHEYIINTRCQKIPFQLHSFWLKKTDKIQSKKKNTHTHTHIYFSNTLNFYPLNKFSNPLPEFFENLQGNCLFPKELNINLNTPGQFDILLIDLFLIIPSTNKILLEI